MTAQASNCVGQGDCELPHSSTSVAACIRITWLVTIYHYHRTHLDLSLHLSDHPICSAFTIDPLLTPKYGLCRSSFQSDLSKNGGHSKYGNGDDERRRLHEGRLYDR